MGEPRPSLSDILYLLTIPNIGPGRIRKLIQVFKDLENIRKAPVQSLVRIESIDLKLASRIKQGGQPEVVQQQLELINRHHINYITIWDDEYPALLKQIPDAPPVLFYEGSLNNLSDRAIAIVGTRSPSSYGRTVTTEITRELVANGISIVSGMARGIDTVAHQTALQHGGHTVAVLGCGIDVCYPPENRKLYQKIPQQGAVVSEYFVGTGPDGPNFPKRNRIISGLSVGTLVIEAGERSGALITALFSLNQNREVFAIPGNINSQRSMGCNHLIKQGGKLVQNVEDILDEIGLSRQEKPAEPRPIPENLTGFERQILEMLSIEPVHIDSLVLKLSEPPSTILSSLLSLELLGLVQQLAGKRFVRN